MVVIEVNVCDVFMFVFAAAVLCGILGMKSISETFDDKIGDSILKNVLFGHYIL